jgi:hypothetical protein
VSEELSWRLNMSTRGAYPVSPTARYLPQRLSDKHVAAFILSRLVQVFEEGESLQSVGLYNESRDAAILFLLSLALGVELGVEGVLRDVPKTGVAVGRAR